MSDETEKTANEAVVVEQGGWRLASDIVIAAGLVLGGIAYLLDKRTQPEAWVGFGLIGLGILVFLVRGQTITGGKAGPGGFEFSTLRKELRKVDEKADAAKQLAAQQFVAVGRSEAARLPDAAEADAASDKAAIEDRGEWPHPGLERGKAPANDPQKGQWGGEDLRNGRRLSATVTEVGDELYEVALTVEPVGNERPIEGVVRFHLHNTFPRMVRMVRPKGGKAKLTVIAWGAFTVGAEVEGEENTYLELDLAAAKYRYPEKFRSR
jgi:pYEATS domain-containing protein involved in immunity